MELQTENRAQVLRASANGRPQRQAGVMICSSGFWSLFFRSRPSFLMLAVLLGDRARVLRADADGVPSTPGRLGNVWQKRSIDLIDVMENGF